MDASERTLFEQSVRRACAAHRGTGLDGALVDLGWLDALAADRASAVAVLFEAQGMMNATSSALDWLMAVSLVDEPGESIAVVLPPLRSAVAPGTSRNGHVVIRGLGTQATAHAETTLAIVAADAGHWAMEIGAEALECRALGGIDPALGLVEVTDEMTLPRDVRGPLVDWHAAVALGQLALGHELVGSARAMLELARMHALERIQFDRPIAGFQAVRHRLADSLVAIEGASSILTAAWDDPSPRMAAMAKSVSGRAARTVARHCQQVLAGIGFTTEHPFHHHVRRTLVLDQLLGAGRVLSAQLGAAVLEDRQLPAPLPL